MTTLGAACRRHHLTLAELAERGEPTAAGREAVEHVGRCPDCAELLGDLMLTVVALRRLGERADAEAGIARTVDRTWPSLRDRIERSRRAAREQAWRWRTSVGSLMTAALAVAALVGPTSIAPATRPVGDWATPGGRSAERLSIRIEAAYVAAARAMPLTVEVAEGSIGLPRYPDNLQPPRKEVQPPRGSGPVLDAR